MLHPVHAKIHQSAPTDWTLHGPLTGTLPCGLMLRFLSNNKATIVSWKMTPDAGFQELMGVSESDPKNFVAALRWLKETMNYKAILIVYQRLQAALISAGLHGDWRVVVEQEDVYLDSLDPGSPEQVFEGALPISLQQDLRALEMAWIPSFSNRARCYRGEFTCRLPESLHARLELMQRGDG